MCLKECGLTTHETTRLRENQIEVSKILNGYENIDRNMFSRLRKREGLEDMELHAKEQCRLDITTFKCSQRTVNDWNTLSADCVGGSNVNMFKN